MNKALIAIIAMVFVGGGIYLLNNKGGDLEATANLEESLTEENANDATPNTLNELLASGEDMTCTFSQTEGGLEQSGTVYVSDMKVRGEFNIEEPTLGSFTVHMLQDKEWNYTWGEPFGENVGTKMKVITTAGAAPRNEGVNLDATMNFDCSSWDAELSMFVVPKTVVFTDISANVGQM